MDHQQCLFSKGVTDLFIDFQEFLEFFVMFCTLVLVR